MRSRRLVFFVISLLILMRCELIEGATPNENPSVIARVFQGGRYQTLSNYVGRVYEYFRHFDDMFDRGRSVNPSLIRRSLQILILCVFLPVAFALGMRLASGEGVLRSISRNHSQTVSKLKSDPQNNASKTDPALLKSYSTYESYTTSIFTYRSIRTFYRPHSQAENLPKKPPLPLLVFIHGLGGSLAQFNVLLTSLTHIAPCLGIDLPGCGLSEFSPTQWEAYSMEALASLVGAVIAKYLKREEGQGFVLIAHSMGCALSTLIASSNSPLSSNLREHALGLVAICPRAEPPSKDQVRNYQVLLNIPDSMFNLFRMWDRRGGIESASVTRFVGREGDEATKKLQERFNNQSMTPVFRRMSWGALPHYDDDGSPHGGFPGLDVWAGLSIPLFFASGQDDQVTKPEEARKIVEFLSRKITEQKDEGYETTPASPDDMDNKSRGNEEHLRSTVDEIYSELPPSAAGIEPQQVLEVVEQKVEDVVKDTSAVIQPEAHFSKSYENVSEVQSSSLETGLPQQGHVGEKKFETSKTEGDAVKTDDNNTVHKVGTLDYGEDNSSEGSTQRVEILAASNTTSPGTEQPPLHSERVVENDPRLASITDMPFEDPDTIMPGGEENSSLGSDFGVDKVYEQTTSSEPIDHMKVIARSPNNDYGNSLEDRSTGNDLEQTKEATETSNTAIDNAQEDTNSEETITPSSFLKPRRRVLKSTILPSPASHSLLFDDKFGRTLAGLIQTFLADHIDARLSPGWQLQHLSQGGKWDVKNLGKWTKVQPVSHPIANTFYAMKTLRGIDDIHTPKKFVHDYRGKIYAVIDISHDSPVYDPADIRAGGIEYYKFSTISKLPPTEEEVHDFVTLIEQVKLHAPTSQPGQEKPLIGVHCHYGFNRTGFFLCAYMIEKMGYSVQEAVDEFSKKRPTGIKHPHFVDELFVRYMVGLRRSDTE